MREVFFYAREAFFYGKRLKAEVMTTYDTMGIKYYTVNHYGYKNKVIYQKLYNNKEYTKAMEDARNYLNTCKY